MKELKRETTIANRFREALSPPSIAGTAASGSRSIFISSFRAFLHFQSFSPGLCVSVVKPSPVFLCGLCGKAFDLPPLKPRRPLFQKRRRPFLLILGSAADAKQSSLQIQSFGERHLHTFVDRLHRVLHRQR